MPGKFQLDPIRDIQVLSPMNRGSLGIRELNLRFQIELNPAKPEEPSVEKFGWQFRIRDKVIQNQRIMILSIRWLSCQSATPVTGVLRLIVNGKICKEHRHY